MADRSELLKTKFPTIPGSSSSRVGKMREEGEVSSGAEDEGITAKSPILEPSHLSSYTFNRTTNNRGASSSVYRAAPQKVTQIKYRTNYTRPNQFIKPPKNRSLSWKNTNKRPLADDSNNNNNLVISFSDDDSETQDCNNNNGILENSNSNSNLETLRNEIALKEKLLKKAIEKVDLNGKGAKRPKLDNNINNSNNKLVHNGEIVLSKAENQSSNINKKREDINTNEALVQTENGEISLKLQTLLDQEEKEERELEEAQLQRRNLEREEREALKSLRKIQQALCSQNEKCNYLQKKRDINSKQIDQLLEASRRYPVENEMDKDREEENNNGEDYERLEASLRSALVARYGSKPPLKSNNDSAGKEKEKEIEKESNSVDRNCLVSTQTQQEENSVDRNGLLLSTQTQEGESLGDPNNLLLSVSTETPQDESLLDRSNLLLSAQHAQEGNSIDPNNLLLSTQPTQEGNSIDQNNLLLSTQPAQEGNSIDRNNLLLSTQPAQEGNSIDRNNLLLSTQPVEQEDNSADRNNLLLSTEEENPVDRNSLLLFTQPPQEKNTDIIMEENFVELANKSAEGNNHTIFVPPSCELRNAFVHLKGKFLSEKEEGELNCLSLESRERIRVCNEQEVDPFWPFCVFELRGKCNDEECKYQHLKKTDWRKPVTFSLSSSSGAFEQSVPRYLIKEDPYQCSVLQRGIGDRKITLKQILEEELPEPEKCLELVLDSSLTRKKALVILSRAMEKDPKFIAFWIVYLHIYYPKEKDLREDDLFLYAVQNNPNSYDLWLMYINSQSKLDHALNAYTKSIFSLCESEGIKREKSGFVLDLFLKMVDLLCMSGNSDRAISRVYEFNSDELMIKIWNYLEFKDKCIFRVCGVYVSIYGKLPQEILESLEFEKDLGLLDIKWPFIEIQMSEKIKILDLIGNSFESVNLLELDQNCVLYLNELQFLAINHVKCIFAIQGLNNASDLLNKYKDLYPNCVELTLISARLGEKLNNDISDLIELDRGYEVALSDWPKEKIGIQCIWNQYTENLLYTKGFEIARNNLNKWFEIYGEFVQNQFGEENEKLENLVMNSDLIFGILNLSLFKLMVRNEFNEAEVLVEKAIKLCGLNLKFYNHCLKEHLMLQMLKQKENILDKNEISGRVVLDLIGYYLKDDFVKPGKKILSRKYFENIEKIRVRELMHEFLGSVSENNNSEVINNVLEIINNLVPQKMEIKKLVNLVESIMQICPYNYKLGFSVCEFANSNFEFEDYGFRFWAGTVLVDSISKSVPVLPEFVWGKGIKVLKDLKLFEVLKRFCERGLVVYPFSLLIWKEYLSLSRNLGENGDNIIEAARERGLQLE